MEELIRIPKTHIKYLVPAYKQRLIEIDELIKTLEEEKKELVSVIKDYSQEIQSAAMFTLSDVMSSSKAGVQPQAIEYGTSWWSRAIYLLKEANKPLSTSELVDMILERQPELKRGEAISSLSSVLGTKAKAGKLTRIVKEGYDQKFSLIE